MSFKLIDAIRETRTTAGVYLYTSARNYFQKDSVMKIMSIYDGTEI
jgi:hypothetical protein